jgi:hypothetical protein
MFAAITVSHRSQQKSSFGGKVALSALVMFMVKNSIIYMQLQEHLYVNAVLADAFSHMELVSHTADKT